MEVKRTVRIKLHCLTNDKQELLKREYRDFQKAVDDESSKLYSATKQQAEKARRQKIRRMSNPLDLETTF